jgi:MYXO-CTERM domain-containing protein
MLVGVVGGTLAVGAAEHDADNETIRHEHPDEVRESGDLLEVQRWLADRMTRIHLNCAENLSAGEAAACDRLDGRYADYLEQYASVERERTGNTDSAETFGRIRENQTELAEAVAAFDETHEEYREARAAGDDERAGELARELRELSRRIETLGGNLDVQFRRIERGTGRDAGSARNSTNETVTAVRETVATVETETFAATELTAETNDSTATFREPATVRGRLTDEAGSGLAGREVVLVVDDRPVARAETDVDGNYEATYRPVTTTTGPTSIAVRYEPSVSEEYAGSEASAAVEVEAVSPSVTMETDAERVAFGETVRVEAGVSVDGIAVSSVPVALFVGEERIATGRTDENGSVVLEGSGPATVPDGDRGLTVVASESGRALRPSESSRSVTVEETTTFVWFRSERDNESIVVTGVLWAPGPKRIVGQELSIRVDGELRTTVRTNGRGRFAPRIPVDRSSAGRREVTVAFEGEGTNLAPARETRRTSAGEGPLERARRVLTDDPQAAAGAGGVFLLALAGLFTRRYRRESDDGKLATPPPNSTRGGTDETGGGSDEPEPRPDPLETAWERLREGAPSEAVAVSYGAVRETLGGGGTDTRTHREFYRDVVEERTGSDSGALKTLTETYERAAFAPSGVDEATAESAVEAAAECLEESSMTDGGTDPGE